MQVKNKKLHPETKKARLFFFIGLSSALAAMIPIGFGGELVGISMPLIFLFLVFGGIALYKYYKLEFRERTLDELIYGYLLFMCFALIIILAMFASSSRSQYKCSLCGGVSGSSVCPYCGHVN